MTPREALRAAAMPKTKAISVPEWGMDLTIRQLSAAQVVSQEGIDEKTALAKSAVASIVDPGTGERLFSDSAEDVAEILSYSFSGLIRLNQEITAFNRIGESPEDAAKNSQASPYVS